jgi:hypothetical protein
LGVSSTQISANLSYFLFIMVGSSLFMVKGVRT